jgi:RsiW-degrading membrane proteinase PrsW (M82 family)
VVVLNALILIAIAVVPVGAWLIFILREDLRPEPKRLLFYTFIMGALATFPTLLLQALTKGFAEQWQLVGVVSVCAFALIEEVFKFLAAYWSVNKEPAFDEPVDAMIYMITAALGFTLVENVFIVGSELTSLSSLSIVSSTILLRFFGATFLHVLASGLVGYFWAKGKMARSLKKFLFAGIVVATAVHALFNLLVMRFETTNLIYPSVLLVFAAFFLFSDFETLRYKERF